MYEYGLLACREAIVLGLVLCLLLVGAWLLIVLCL
jgi:type II secretory pathway component PulM